jgi:hypothetical protein
MSTPDDIVVDVRIESNDPSAVEAIEQHLRDVNPRRLEETRDLATILTVSAAAVSLVKSLVELWKELRKRRTMPRVTVENASGAQLNLSDVSSEAEIEGFISKGNGD